MKISETLTHTASADEVFAIFSDVDYQNLKCERSGALDHEVVIELDDQGGTIIVTNRQLPTDGFPDFAKRFVGETVTVIEKQEWAAASGDGARTAALTVEIPQTPVRLNGAARLTPTGSGCDQVVEGDLKANIPLIGGKIEGAVAPILVKAIRLEGRLVERWLADQKNEA